MIVFFFHVTLKVVVSFLTHRVSLHSIFFSFPVLILLAVGVGPSAVLITISLSFIFILFQGSQAINIYNNHLS